MVAVAGALAIPTVLSLQNLPKLNNASQEVISALRTAQNKTLSSEDNSRYGVYFNTTGSPHQYTIFKGASYAARDSAFDITSSIPSTVEFYQINTGGSGEVVFDKLTGATQNSGDISLRLKDDTSQTKIISIYNSGIISFNAITLPTDTRTKDSRHIAFTYNRVIDTATENIVLTFNGTTVKTIPIKDYLNVQFDWEDTVDVGGTGQTIRIHTLSLNSPDTTFSIFRDLRFNTASLEVAISGDVTGNLAEYSADGLTTNFYSIYVNDFAWQ